MALGFVGSALVSTRPRAHAHGRAADRCALRCCARGEDTSQRDGFVHAPILVCTGKTCVRDGSKFTAAALDGLLDAGANGAVVRECGCLGECGNGPNVVFYERVQRRMRPVSSILQLAERYAAGSERQTGGVGINLNSAVAKALEEADRARKIASKSDSAYATKQALGCFENAIQLLRNGSSPCPSRAYLEAAFLSNCAVLRLQQGEAASALENANEAIGLVPDHPRSWASRALSHAHLGAADEADKCLTVLKKLDKDIELDTREKVREATKARRKFRLF
ncbi:hypothetical protein FVE85_8311 [Porphyridium purpureum]|uniref:Uncharacterized protein n=1 Tax=Porphyridium purpureum TaxID=35688 RepID=A0A5J4YK71_PORPP|nr:hypothetical protein FVE85_8311 [Porphyridium purpureum]|eukprot:POR8564..scf244_11